MKPILKWVGGKRRFINVIEKNINKDEVKRYLEPFLGSGALFFHLNLENSVIADLNFNLINFYEKLRDEPKKLFQNIEKTFSNFNDENFYYEKRAEYNKLINSKESSMEKAVLFFYLNKACFNGVYRVNSDGFFNVPIGKNKTHHVPSLREFFEYSELLKKTEIISNSYSELLEKPKKGDLFYLDPPYFPDETSKFLGYTDPKFDESEHEKMVMLSKKAVEKGAKVIISNSNSSKFKNIVSKYFGNNYKMEIIPTNRSINPNAKNKERFLETLYILS